MGTREAVPGRLWFGGKAVGLGGRWEVNATGPSGRGWAGGGRRPLLLRAGHILKCPSQILSVTGLDIRHGALRSQDPLIPIGFLATDRVGVRVKSEEKLDQERQGQGGSSCHLPSSKFAFHAKMLRWACSVLNRS